MHLCARLTVDGAPLKFIQLLLHIVLCTEMEEVDNKENNTSTPPTEEEESKLYLYKMTDYQTRQKGGMLDNLLHLPVR